MSAVSIDDEALARLRSLFRGLTFMAVWFAGCVVFDRLLQWQGVLMMLGGAITLMVAETLKDCIVPCTGGAE